MTRPSSTSGRAPNVAIVAAVVVVAIAVVAVLAVRLLSDDDAGGDATSTSTGTAATLSPECEQIHAGHNTMSWNPTMADEMLGCGWPYDPFTSTLEGGEEDGSLDEAPFDPVPYADIWTAIGTTGLGSCGVSTLPDPPADGFAFGFTYAVAEAGCPEATPTAEVEVREYATRPQRDAAAAVSAEEPDGATYVLGRWVIAVRGEDQAQADALSDAVGELGAVRVDA